VDIENALQYTLANTAGVSNLVGSRIYYVKAPQDVVKPYVVIQKISAIRFYAYSGESGLDDTRVQISIFATTYASCKAIAAAIQTAISAFVGTMGGAGGVYVGACFYDNEVDLPFDDTLKLYGLALDYKLLHA